MAYKIHGKNPCYKSMSEKKTSGHGEDSSAQRHPPEPRLGRCLVAHLAGLLQRQLRLASTHGTHEARPSEAKKGPVHQGKKGSKMGVELSSAAKFWS